jgi:5'-3' exonuclease
MKQSERIRVMVKTMYDYQDMRVRSGNRLRKKKDGSDQNVKNMDDAEMIEIPALVDVWFDTEEIEKKLAKEIEKEVKAHLLWKDFLKDVKGCGPLMAAVIISEYDIYKATNVSKLWQFTGLNPGTVYGKKPKGSKIEGTYYLETTNTKIRGDRLTAGFIAPFNQFLRTKMVGVLGSSFIKCGSPYREFYDNMKIRLEAEETGIQGLAEGKEKSWNETTPKHRHNAAMRYMIKMFLKDLYVAWRTIEGLEVRAPYQEEYLGHKHS